MRTYARVAIVAVFALAGITVGPPAAFASTEYQASAFSPGGAVVAAARYTKYANGDRQWCVKAVNSGHAVAYLRSATQTITIDEWGGDTYWWCQYLTGTTGVSLGLSVEYYLADGTRYAYSDVVSFTG